MLILTRRIGETLVIGDGTTATILDIKGNQIRLGIDAPKEIEILREEILIDLEQPQPIQKTG